MNRVVHFEIHADDMERAKKFYQDAFGWQAQDMGAAYGDYVVLISGPRPDEMVGKPMDIKSIGINGGMMKRNATKAPAGSSPNAFVSVIGVDNIAEIMPRIEAAGGKPHTDLMDIPNVGKIRYYEDTEGNVFGIIEPLPM